MLKFLAAETFGRLDGNGHISTLLTDGPNPSSLVKSIHPDVGIFYARITAKTTLLTPLLAKAGSDREGVCQVTGISGQLCVWEHVRPFDVGHNRGSVTILLFACDAN